jgi:hypothetical protein
LFVVFRGSTAALIPLFAVGVFLAFTLSQAGMVAHWLRYRGPHWRRSLAFNALGCALSALVFVVVGTTKFVHGAWIVVVLIPSIVLTLLAYHRREMRLRATTALRPPGQDGAECEEAPDQLRSLCLVLITELDLPNLRALAYAASLRQPTLALHVSPDQADADRLQRAWRAWGDHIQLEIVSSPYRALVPPLVHYIGALRAQQPELTITIVMPELVASRGWRGLVHERTGDRMRRALRSQPKTVVTVVPFHPPTSAGVCTLAEDARGSSRKSRVRPDDRQAALIEHSAHVRE